MEIISELLPETFLLRPSKFQDPRGTFVKTYHQTLFAELGIRFDMKEEFYSISKKNVIRGMHFQTPPHAHDKLVYCLNGKVLDVLIDLRTGPGYGRVASTELSLENGMILLIPKGIAHGFLALSDESLLLYKTSTTHEQSADSAIRWNSFGYAWGVAHPILSERDHQHPPLSEFTTPF